MHRWSADLVAHVGREIYEDMNCLSAWKEISRGALVAILDTVRTRVLDFVLELEAEDPMVGEVAIGSTPPIPEERISDSRFHDLMDDPLACVEQIYKHFDMSLSADARKRMTQYLADKPRGKFGAHRYTVGEDELSERRFFRNYQEAYDVPDEV